MSTPEQRQRDLDQVRRIAAEMKIAHTMSMRKASKLCSSSTLSPPTPASTMTSVTQVIHMKYSATDGRPTVHTPPPPTTRRSVPGV